LRGKNYCGGDVDSENPGNIGVLLRVENPDGDFVLILRCEAYEFLAMLVALLAICAEL